MSPTIPEAPPSPISHEIILHPFEEIPEEAPVPMAHVVDLYPAENWVGDVPQQPNPEMITLEGGLRSAETEEVAPSQGDRRLGPKLELPDENEPAFRVPLRLHENTNAGADLFLTASNSAVIVYDLKKPPTSIGFPMNHVPLHFWDQPVAQPLRSSISIVCLRLPWRITIHSSSKPYVTVMDVLDGLYYSLRTPVTAAEFALLEAGEARMRVTDAFISRFQSISDPERQALEKAGGLKRVDFLQNYNIFDGIVGPKDGEDSWTLMVSNEIHPVPFPPSSCPPVPLQMRHC